MSSAVRKQMEIYKPIIEGMLSIAHLEWTLAAICEALVSNLGYRMVWIGAVDWERHEVRPISEKGLGGELFSSIRGKLDDLPSAGGALGEALRSGVPVVDHDISSDPTYALWRGNAARSQWYAVLPVKVRGDIIGVLNIFSDKEDAFKSDEIGVLGAFSQAVGVAMEKSKAGAPKSATGGQTKHTQTVTQKLVDPGEIYVYGGNLEDSLHLFKSHLDSGWKGLVVADKYVIETHGRGLLRDVPAFKFTADIDSSNAVWTYSGLSILISSLMRVTQKPLAFIDRPEVLENGPEKGYFAPFIEDLHRNVSQNNAATIMRIEKIEDRLMDTLKRNCKFL
nr:GAF domain-containing protein [Candidatus Njordarchaeota archaeon]